MGFQILNSPSFESRLGQSLGTGLKNLADYKLQDLQQVNQQRQISRGLTTLQSPNSTVEQKLQAVSLLPAELQKTVLENISPYLKNSIQRQSSAGFTENLQTPQQFNVQGSPLNNLMKMEQGGSPAASMMNTQFQQIPQYQQPQQPIQQESIDEFGKLFETETMKARRLKEEEFAFKKENERLKLEDKKLARMDENERKAFESTKGERSEAYLAENMARNNMEDLKRLQELEDEGLISNAYDQILKGAGIDNIPALLNPASEEFKKIRQTFLRDAKNYFGGKVSNFEVEQFLNTIPDLSQTPEGRKRVIANLKRFNRLAIKRGETMRSIIKENNGVPPRDFLEQVQERMADYSGALAAKFKKDIARPVPKGSSKLATIAGRGLGSVIGEIGEAIPSSIVGALGGGALGFASGGLPGAAVGALRGAGAGALAKTGAKALKGFIGL